MNFEAVLTLLVEGCNQLRIRYALCGGFALGVLGAARATADVDVLVHGDDLEKLHQWLTSAGYVRKAQTANVTQYIHPDAARGALDILHAIRKHSLAMLERAGSHALLGGTRTVRVLQPEDVIGFKIQGMANNPLRRAKETVDIEALMEHYGARLDWNRIQEFYDLFELSDEGHRLRERFSHVE